MKNGTGRTPLALAFGDHPGHCHGFAFPADKAFFKAAVVPFLEKAVVGEGRPAVVIHEFNTCIEMGHLDRTNPDHAAAVEKIMGNIEDEANSSFLNSLDAGMRPARHAEWFDWGYIEDIARINRSSPGKIHNIIEPLRASTAWLLHDQMAIYDGMKGVPGFGERVALECEVIRQSIRICLERSRRVSALVKSIRESRPDAAIVVPRGWAHKGMAADFDFTDFQITVSAGLRGVPHFSSEAIAESFTRDLSDLEIARYARLSLYYNAYFSRNRDEFASILQMGQDMAEKGIWAFNAEARRFALDIDAGQACNGQFRQTG